MLDVFLFVVDSWSVEKPADFARPSFRSLLKLPHKNSLFDVALKSQFVWFVNIEKKLKGGGGCHEFS